MGFVVEKTFWYPSEVSRFPSIGQLHLVINHEGRGLFCFVHVKFN